MPFWLTHVVIPLRLLWRSSGWWAKIIHGVLLSPSFSFPFFFLYFGLFSSALRSLFALPRCHLLPYLSLFVVSLLQGGFCVLVSSSFSSLHIRLCSFRVHLAAWARFSAWPLRLIGLPTTFILLICLPSPPLSPFGTSDKERRRGGSRKVLIVMSRASRNVALQLWATIVIAMRFFFFKTKLAIVGWGNLMEAELLCSFFLSKRELFLRSL